MVKKMKERCNLCGKQFDRFDRASGLKYVQQLGFGSAFDGSVLVLRLCVDCLDDLASECVINPLFVSAEEIDEDDFEDECDEDGEED